MMQFHRGGDCVRYCGSSTDSEGGANFALSLEACHLRGRFIFDGFHYRSKIQQTIDHVDFICHLLHLH